MEQLKPCRCGNKYPTLECTTIKSKYSFYFFYCKNTFQTSVFQKKKLSKHGTGESTISKIKIQPFSERFWQRGINYTPEPFDTP